MGLVTQEEMQARLEALSEQKIGEIDTRANEAIKRFDAAVNNANKKINDQANNSTKGFNDRIKKSEERIKLLDETYERKLKLKAAVTYWEKRKWTHWAHSAVYACIISLIAWLGWDWINNSITELMNLELIKAPKSDEVVQLRGIPLWRLGVFALMITLYVWALKIIVKIIMSQLHLANVAGERIVMTQTYLALSKDGAIPQEKDMRLILTSLFHPTPTGIVKEDTVPPGMLDFISKRI